MSHQNDVKSVCGPTEPLQSGTLDMMAAVAEKLLSLDGHVHCDSSPYEAYTRHLSAGSSSESRRHRGRDATAPRGAEADGEIVVGVHVPVSISRRPEWAAYPLRDITTPHANDVLCGRGGGTNNHPGNASFREIVTKQKVNYVTCSKKEKPLIARGIVESIRLLTPPGRFLQKDDARGAWCDIGDYRAREKTSQTLREGAPFIRKDVYGVSTFKPAATTTAATTTPTPTDTTTATTTATATRTSGFHGNAMARNTNINTHIDINTMRMNGRNLPMHSGPVQSGLHPFYLPYVTNNGCNNYNPANNSNNNNNSNRTLTQHHHHHVHMPRHQPHVPQHPTNMHAANLEHEEQPPNETKAPYTKSMNDQHSKNGGTKSSRVLGQKGKFRKSVTPDYTMNALDPDDDTECNNNDNKTPSSCPSSGRISCSKGRERPRHPRVGQFEGSDSSGSAKTERQDDEEETNIKQYHDPEETVSLQIVRKLLLGRIDPVKLAAQILSPDDAAVVAKNARAASELVFRGGRVADSSSVLDSIHRIPQAFPVPLPHDGDGDGDDDGNGKRGKRKR